MISRIGVENRNINNVQAPLRKCKENTNPSFQGGDGVVTAALGALQACERNPMVNVAVIDMFSAILPRTFVESLTNWYAGFEALRRESSGLIVNCLIPSGIAFGYATLMNNFLLPKGANMAGCWADSSLIQKATDIYSNTSEPDKVKGTFKELLNSVQGFDGKNKVLYKEVLSQDEIENYATKLKEFSLKNESKMTRQERKAFKKEFSELTKEIAQKTHVFDNIQIADGKTTVKATTLNTLLKDSVKYFKEYQKTDGVSIQDFAKKSKKLITTKSLLGLATILPLAASMQYINRWITEKSSGVKGAPIYDDYGQKDSIKDSKAKDGLLKQKIISISSMVGVSMLSMMKMPSLSMLRNMIEFKGIFPSMDQARLISTTTFASRMSAADDKNELAEATVRDIATFSSLYFLGDYAAKATATIIEKTKGIRLLNDTKPLDKHANIFKRFWHWVKDVNIKSSEEVVSKTADMLKAKGLKPTEADKKVIEKELKQAVNLRSACQAANLGVSLLLLGLVIPIFTRKNTQKKHAAATELARESASSNVDSQKDLSKTNPIDGNNETFKLDNQQQKQVG
jgi:hypothetical protein